MPGTHFSKMYPTTVSYIMYPVQYDNNACMASLYQSGDVSNFPDGIYFCDNSIAASPGNINVECQKDVMHAAAYNVSSEPTDQPRLYSNCLNDRRNMENNTAHTKENAMSISVPGMYIFGVDLYKYIHGRRMNGI